MAKNKIALQGLLTPLLIVLLVGAAFFIGRLSAQVETLKNNQTTQPSAQATGQQQAAPSVTMDTIKGLFKKDVVTFGNANSKLVFVDVSDPSCPYCHIASGLDSTLNNQDPRFKLKKDGGTYVAPQEEVEKLARAGKVAYVWIYDNGHGNGEMGTRALWCANEKGKFWQVHDLLYSDAGYEMLNNTVQNDLKKAGTLADFLKGAVDKSFLESCMTGGKYDSRLQTDVALSQSLGVSGTPGFFVNTTLYPGAVNYTDGMQAQVEQILGK